MGVGRSEHETNDPFAGDAPSVDFRRSENPAPDSFHGEVGEVFAGARRIQFGFGDIARGVHVSADADANTALNGGARFFGDVGQNLVENFAARGCC